MIQLRAIALIMLISMVFTNSKTEFHRLRNLLDTGYEITVTHEGREALKCTFDYRTVSECSTRGMVLTKCAILDSNLAPQIAVQEGSTWTFPFINISTTFAFTNPSLAPKFFNFNISGTSFKTGNVAFKFQYKVIGWVIDDVDGRQIKDWCNQCRNTQRSKYNRYLETLQILVTRFGSNSILYKRLSEDQKSIEDEVKELEARLKELEDKIKAEEGNANQLTDSLNDLERKVADAKVINTQIQEKINQQEAIIMANEESIKDLAARKTNLNLDKLKEECEAKRVSFTECTNTLAREAPRVENHCTNARVAILERRDIPECNRELRKITA